MAGSILAAGTTDVMSVGIGIGFTIGETPIGSTPFDYKPTIISQYANSPTINTLIADFSAWLDPTWNFDTFYDYVWNIDTAQGFGLDIWGRIVVVGRVYAIGDAAYFGFEGAAPAVGFNQGVFWSGNPISANFSLSDAAYRQLILAKAQSNILDGSIPAINKLLMQMFPNRGNAYVIDNEDMTMIYKFEFALSPVDLTLINNSGVLPQPCGMTISVEHL